MLRDHQWKLKYTSDDHTDLVAEFYIPALEDAERYDRLTGYFNARALALAARCIEGLVRNGGVMRLVVGCTLNEPEIQAIEEGEALRAQVERHLGQFLLVATEVDYEEALELLAWMVAHRHLDVKVAVPCDGQRNPVPETALFHEKSGVIEDRTGEKIAWTGRRIHCSALLQPAPERDRCRVARELGDHQRCHQLERPEARKGGGRQLPARVVERSRALDCLGRAGRRAPRPDAFPAEG